MKKLIVLAVLIVVLYSCTQTAPQKKSFFEKAKCFITHCEK